MKPLVQITIGNIGEFKGTLNIKPGDLPFGMWQVFDRSAFDASEEKAIISLEDIISAKNELLDPEFLAGKKPDPRQTAFNYMTAAGKGQHTPRAPITVRKTESGKFLVEDGNATVQVLMLAGWTEVPVEIIESLPDGEESSSLA